MTRSPLPLSVIVAGTRVSVTASFRYTLVRSELAPRASANFRVNALLTAIFVALSAGLLPAAFSAGAVLSTR